MLVLDDHALTKHGSRLKHGSLRSFTGWHGKCCMAVHCSTARGYVVNCKACDGDAGIGLCPHHSVLQSCGKSHVEEDIVTVLMLYYRLLNGAGCLD